MGEAYQFTTPALDVALNNNVPASQRDPGVVEAIVGIPFTVIVIEEVQLLLPFVTVQLYIVVVVGVTVMIFEVCGVGFHNRVLPLGRS